MTMKIIKKKLFFFFFLKKTFSQSMHIIELLVADAIFVVVVGMIG